MILEVSHQDLQAGAYASPSMYIRSFGKGDRPACHSTQASLLPYPFTDPDVLSAVCDEFIGTSAEVITVVAHLLAETWMLILSYVYGWQSHVDH